MFYGMVGRNSWFKAQTLERHARVDATEPLACEGKTAIVICSRYLKIEAEVTKRLAQGHSYASQMGPSQIDVA